MSLTVPRRVVLAAPLAATPALAAPADPLAGGALYRDVVAYAGFGEHRTGGAPDHATSRWLASELERSGFKTELVPWRTRQLLDAASLLTVNGQSVESFPIWWPAPTGREPLKGTLTPLEREGRLDGKVALAAVDGLPGGGALSPGNPVATMIAQAHARGGAGFILVERTRNGELAALNAQDGVEPRPIPCLLVGGADEAKLREAAGAGAAAEISILGRPVSDAVGYEVLGRIGSGPKEVIVSTPSSGWFHCAGERGPGIAIWLALARSIGRSPPPGVRFTFVASSGHELDGIGMHHFLKEIAPKPEQVKSWLHLGAGIATYGYDGARRLDTVSTTRGLMTNDPALMPALERDFAGQPGLKPVLTDKPVGEMAYMAEHGYRCWGIAGGWALHHMRSDLPERATSPAILEPTARAIHRALLAAVA